MTTCRCIKKFSTGKDLDYDSCEGIVEGIVVPPNGARSFHSILLTLPGRRSAPDVVEHWDIENGLLLTTFQFEGWEVINLIVLNDGESFVCLFVCGTIGRYNLSNRECVGTFRTHRSVYWIAKLDDNRVLTIQNEAGDGLVSVWDINTGERLAFVNTTRNSYILEVIILSTERVLVLQRDQEAFVWNVTTDSIESEWSKNGQILSVAALADGETLVCGILRGTAYSNSLVKVDSGEEVHRFSNHDYWRTVVLISARRFLCITDRENDISMYSIESGERTFVFRGTAPIMSIKLVDEFRFVALGKDGTVKLWDFSHWLAVKQLILLRELVKRGRASSMQERSHRKRLRQDRDVGTVWAPDTILQSIICFGSDGIFREVVSYVY